MAVKMAHSDTPPRRNKELALSRALCATAEREKKVSSLQGVAPQRRLFSVYLAMPDFEAMLRSLRPISQSVTRFRPSWQSQMFASCEVMKDPKVRLSKMESNQEGLDLRHEMPLVASALLQMKRQDANTYRSSSPLPL